MKVWIDKVSFCARELIVSCGSRVRCFEAMVCVWQMVGCSVCRHDIEHAVAVTKARAENE